MRPLLLVLCVSLSGCMHGCGGDAADGDREGPPTTEAPSAGAEGDAVEAVGTEGSEDYAEPPPVEPPD
jgi:hypothetical protein